MVEGSYDQTWVPWLAGRTMKWTDEGVSRSHAVLPSFSSELTKPITHQ